MLNEYKLEAVIMETASKKLADYADLLKGCRTEAEKEKIFSAVDNAILTLDDLYHYSNLPGSQEVSEELQRMQCAWYGRPVYSVDGREYGSYWEAEIHCRACGIDAKGIEKIDLQNEGYLQGVSQE